MVLEIMKCSLFVGLVRSESLKVSFYIRSMQNACNPKPNYDAGDGGGGGDAVGGDDDDDYEL